MFAELCRHIFQPLLCFPSEASRCLPCPSLPSNWPYFMKLLTLYFSPPSRQSVALLYQTRGTARSKQTRICVTGVPHKVLLMSINYC